MADASPLGGNAPSAPEPPAAPAPTPSAKTEDAGAPPEKKDDTTTTPPATPPKDEKPKADVKPEEPEHKTPKELRSAYEALKAKHKEAEKKLAEVAAQKPAEVKPPDPTEHPEFKSMKERVEAIAKRNRELEEEIQYVDYEKSQEFQDKYHKPYTDLSSRLARAATELRGVDAEGQPRPVAPEEFWKIVTTPNGEDALALAEQIYGSPSKAARVAAMRDQIVESWETMNRAKAEFKTKGGERAKELQSRMESELKRDRELFHKFNADAVKEHPHYFAPIEGDAKGNELLAKGYEFVDKAFVAQPNMPPEERVALHSKVRNQAAGFDRLAYRLSATEKERDALKEKIAQYEQSQPGGGEIHAGGGKESGGWEAELDKLGA